MAPGVNQPFPTSGRLAKNLNPSLRLLQSILRGQSGPVYAYIVDTVRCDGDTFVQTGSGPNFQGDLITLSTCKHQMRSGVLESEWPGNWIAGFTSVDAVQANRANYLVYLMMVEDAYSSHADLWDDLDHDTRQAKAADVNRLGDLYRPHGEGDPFDPASYEAPRLDHAHCHEYGWHTDIDYSSPVYGRRAPLLVGDPDFSFLWSRPLIGYPSGVHPRTKKHDLTTMLAELVNRPVRTQR